MGPDPSNAAEDCAARDSWMGASMHWEQTTISDRRRYVPDGMTRAAATSSHLHDARIWCEKEMRVGQLADFADNLIELCESIAASFSDASGKESRPYISTSGWDVLVAESGSLGEERKRALDEILLGRTAFIVFSASFIIASTIRDHPFALPASRHIGLSGGIEQLSRLTRRPPAEIKKLREIFLRALAVDSKHKRCPFIECPHFSNDKMTKPQYAARNVGR